MSYTEYTTGFIQGKVQHELIAAARDNSWNNMYCCDQAHTFPKWLRPLATYKAARQSKQQNGFLDEIRHTGNME